MKNLPSSHGSWGFLLPVTDEGAIHQADAFHHVGEINPSFLRFSSTGMLSDRGFNFFLFSSVSIVSILSISIPVFLFLAPKLYGEGEFLGLFFVTTTAFLIQVVCLRIAFVSARKPLDPPIILSRRDRQLHFFDDLKKQWCAIPYDKMVAAVIHHRNFSMGGSISMYSLRFHHIEPDDPTRHIHAAYGAGEPFMSPDAPGQLWEFIRIYMDGSPENLPAVKLLPDYSHPKAWMAITDRKGLGDAWIDENHRVRKTWGIAVWFMGIMFYWSYRAASWIWRTAPRFPLPAQVQNAMQWEGPNPYALVPLSPIEQQAYSGTLPHMCRRWLICGICSTLFYLFWMGAMPVGMLFKYFHDPVPQVASPQQESRSTEGNLSRDPAISQ